MASPKLSAVVLLSAVAVGAALSAQDESSVTAMATANQLSREQTDAFRACHAQMSGKGLTTINPHGTVKRNNVPDEICVCQARLMAETFTTGQYDEHRLVVEHKTSGAGAGSLSRSVLKSAAVDGSESFLRLAEHLTACAVEYQRQQEAKTEQVKQQLMHRQASSR